MKDKDMRDITPFCRIGIDKNGRWFYEGQEIINPGVLATFQDALEMTEDGRFRVVMGPEICYIEVEDTPFIITTLKGDSRQGFTLLTNNGATFALEPKRLWIGEDNIMYTRLPGGMPARLSRPAYYALALAMEEDPQGNIILSIGDTSHIISHLHLPGINPCV